MKNFFGIFLISTFLLSIFSCKEDDSLAISQDQLLRAHKWQLKEIRYKRANVDTVDKLLECERQSTLDFRDVEKYFSVVFETINGNCQETVTEGKYTFEAEKSKRTLNVTPTNGELKKYYMEQLDPYYMIIQDSLIVNDTLHFRRFVYQPVK